MPTLALEAPLPVVDKFTADEGAPKLPDLPPTEGPEKPKTVPDTAKSAATPAPAQQTKPEDEFEALARRFEALKRR